MQLDTVTLACFSPTGTTRKVLEGIAKGMGAAEVKTVDATLPHEREKPLVMGADEVLVIGVPVYMGRVPAMLADWLGSLKGDNTPVVCVAVYGNREYEDALLELGDAVEQAGFVPVAAAAFIGEHSFSTPEKPTAQGRPDTEDMQRAVTFGQAVREKLEAVANPATLPRPGIPGNKPYGGRTSLWDVDFIVVSEQCVQCGLCAEVCPVAAVDPDDSGTIDHVLCITCCACIKNCPQQARAIKPGPVMDAQNRLHTLFAERREPEVFL